MLVATWTPEGIEVGEHQATAVPDGFARLQVTGCGICGSDLHIYRHMRSGEADPVDYATPGHEVAGILVDGPAWMADAQYAVEPWVNCQTCGHCQRGETTLCPEAGLMGINVAGGLAEFIDVPTRLLHPIDAGLSPTVASLAEPWAVAVRAVHRARLTEIGDRVLILGGGSIGLLCGLAARDRAALVGITCRYPHQAALARSFGLEVIDPDDLVPWANEHQPGVVIETVGGTADTISDAVASAGRGGRIVVVGVFSSPRPTDYRELILKELEIVGSFIYGTVRDGSEFGAAVGRMDGIGPELAQLQTHHFPLSEAVHAFEVANDKANEVIKVTIGESSDSQP